MKPMMIVVPRSGCSMISAIGTAATTSARPTSTIRGWSSASRFSDRIIARPTHSATLANSEGCTEKPPGRMIHECDPLTVLPNGDSTAMSPSTEAM